MKKYLKEIGTSLFWHYYHTFIFTNRPSNTQTVKLYNRNGGGKAEQVKRVQYRFTGFLCVNFMMTNRENFGACNFHFFAQIWFHLSDLDWAGRIKEYCEYLHVPFGQNYI